MNFYITFVVKAQTFRRVFRLIDNQGRHHGFKHGTAPTGYKWNSLPFIITAVIGKSRGGSFNAVNRHLRLPRIFFGKCTHQAEPMFCRYVTASDGDVAGRARLRVKGTIMIVGIHIQVREITVRHLLFHFVIKK